jgi:hypothetical protein
LKNKKRINSKRKGSRVELEFAKIFSNRFNLEFKRVPFSGAWGTSNKGQNIREDAMEILSGDILCPKGFKFSIECKAREGFNFWDMLNNDTQHLEIDDWIVQAENDAEISNKEPLIIIKINKRNPFVLFPKKLHETNMTYGKYSVMRFDYFLKIDDEFFWQK